MSRRSAARGRRFNPVQQYTRDARQRIMLLKRCARLTVELDGKIPYDQWPPLIKRTFETRESPADTPLPELNECWRELVRLRDEL